MKFRVSGAPVAATLLRLLQLDPKRGRVAFLAVASARFLSHFHPAEISSGFRSRGLKAPSFSMRSFLAGAVVNWAQGLQDWTS